MKKLALEVELKDGKLYHKGEPVESQGEFYLVRKGTFEEIVNRIRERNTSPDESVHKMSDELKEALPQSITIDNKFVYGLVPEVRVSRGKFLWVPYRTLEQELDEALEQGGQNE